VSFEFENESSFELMTSFVIVELVFTCQCQPVNHIATSVIFRVDLCNLVPCNVCDCYINDMKDQRLFV